MTKHAMVCLLLIGCASPDRHDPARDEQAIRRYFASWMKATTEGDLDLAKRLIADDAVFLVPGAGRMNKADFAAAATASDPNTDFQLDCSIEEIQVFGDHAWVVTKLGLTMTDKKSKARTRFAGHSLSILKRKGDGWITIRDANTAGPVKED